MNERQEDLLMEKLDIIISLLEERKPRVELQTIDEYASGKAPVSGKCPGCGEDYFINQTILASGELGCGNCEPPAPTCNGCGKPMQQERPDLWRCPDERHCTKCGEIWHGRHICKPFVFSDEADNGGGVA